MVAVSAQVMVPGNTASMPSRKEGCPFSVLACVALVVQIMFYRSESVICDYLCVGLYLCDGL